MPEPRTVTQADSPCVLHLHHSPITVINELHHPFPQAWQRKLWGEVRDHQVISVCATGHNTIHHAIAYYGRVGRWPTWCVGKTLFWANQAFVRLEEARGGL